MILMLSSCKPGQTQKPSVEVVIEEKEDPGRMSNGPDEITITADYTSQGAIINIPARMSHELTYFKGKVIREKMASHSGGMSMVVTQEFDEKNRLKTLRSEQNGNLSVLQTNTYTEDDLLLTEHRLEAGESGFDTILYEYHFPAQRTNPLTYYRTNNGVRVTEMMLTKNGFTEIIREQALGNDGHVGIIITTKEKNANGDVIKEYREMMFSDWSDQTKIDTTYEGPSLYTYDEAGRLIRSETTDLTGKSLITESFYAKDGILEKRIIKKGSQPAQTVNYRRL